ARIKRRHHHDGNVDLRKQVHRHARNGGDAHHRNHQAQHDDEIRISQREFRHYLPPLSPDRATSISFGVTFMPLRNSLRLPTTTRSPSVKPSRTSTRVLPCTPSFTLRSSRMFRAFTTRTSPSLDVLPNSTASSGTVSISERSSGVTTACTYIP